jgi:DNA-binding CsgD family transcriptional regulator
MITASPRSDEFIGRADELAFLHARALDARAGSSCAIVVTGEAGIGKTRLLDEFVRREGGEMRVLRVRCSATVSSAAVILQEFCESIAALSDGEPPRFLDAGQALAYVRSGIRKLRASTAVGIIVEDGHHAASDALDALEQLCGIERTMLILTAEPANASADVHEAMVRLRRRNAHEIVLAPLSAEAMRRMIRRFQGAGVGLSRSLVSRVVEYAHGNPALAEELVRAASAADDAGELPVPYALRKRVRQMMGPLDAEMQNLLLIAAALGVRFDLRSLAHIAGMKLTFVRRALQSASTAALIVETQPEHFRFADPLYRQALRAETTAAFGIGYHRRAALYLERTASDVEGFAAVAEQWRGARECERASQWDERAGDAAAERSSFVSAAAAYRRAHQDCEPGARRRALLFKRASVLGRAGMEREAIEAFDEYLVGGVDDDLDAYANALLQKCMLSWDAGAFPDIESLAHQVLALDLPADSPAKARALLEIAGVRWTEGRLDETAALVAQVERDYTLTDPTALGMYYQQRALVTHAARGFAAALPDFRLGVEHMGASGDAVLYTQVLCNLGNLALLHAHNELALEMLERACATARMGLSESRLHFALGSYARALIRVGRNAEAHCVLDELRSMDVDLADLNALFSVAAMIELSSMFEDDALVERAMDSDTLPRAFESGDAKRILALAGPIALYRWHAGDEEGASALLHEALLVSEGPTWHYPLAVLVAQFGPLTDVPRARRMLKPPLVLGEQCVIDAFNDLFDAFVARRRGRNGAAAASGRRAAARFAAIGWPYYEAQAREVAGDHSEALQIYDRLGDVRDAKKLRAALRPTQRSGRHAVALTDREREVAALALEGKSNLAISKRLAISVRTVEHHLQVIYGKFGIRSRWQIPHDL